MTSPLSCRVPPCPQCITAPLPAQYGSVIRPCVRGGFPAVQRGAVTAAAVTPPLASFSEVRVLARGPAVRAPLTGTLAAVCPGACEGLGDESGLRRGDGCRPPGAAAAAAHRGIFVPRGSAGGCSSRFSLAASRFPHVRQNRPMEAFSRENTSTAAGRPHRQRPISRMYAITVPHSALSDVVPARCSGGGMSSNSLARVSAYLLSQAPATRPLPQARRITASRARVHPPHHPPPSVTCTY
jgi:hypothetical protein